MSTTPVIDVERLNLKYGDFHAVKDLSFQVRKGELYALLGTNGAGKTSALETVEGHRTATSGVVRVFGHSPRDRSAVRPRMGIMLQESGFSPDLTVRESVRLIGGLTRRTDDAGRVLDVVGLTRKAGTKVAQLSGGEKRRLDFATAVYGMPELVFLDEPTTGLDIQSRDDLWQVVDKLRENGSTIVLTTHYLEEAQQRADRIGLMHEGTLHREGTVSELTRSLPAAIRFSLSAPAPALPLQATGGADGTYLIETFSLQKDLLVVLRWAQEQGLELHGLEAAPTRLDDVFRAIGGGHTPFYLRKGFAMLSIAVSELLQIFRNRLVLVTSIIMPVVVSAFFIYQHEGFATLGSLGYIAAIVMFTVAAFGLYTTTVTTLASRRQNLFLKRLRSTAAGDAVILAGLILPATLLALIQVAAILTVLAVVTGRPAGVLLLVAAVVATMVMMIGLGLATAGLTNSPEHAQVTTLPVSLGVIAVASWVGISGTGELTLLKRLLPGGSATELVVSAWNGGVALTDSLLLLAPTFGWVVVAVVLATRLFRWEPRR